MPRRDVFGEVDNADAAPKRSSIHGDVHLVLTVISEANVEDAERKHRRSLGTRAWYGQKPLAAARPGFTGDSWPLTRTCLSCANLP